MLFAILFLFFLHHIACIISSTYGTNVALFRQKTHDIVAIIFHYTIIGYRVPQKNVKKVCKFCVLLDALRFSTFKMVVRLTIAFM